jgi:hypothetical protein
MNDSWNFLLISRNNGNFGRIHVDIGRNNSPIGRNNVDFGRIIARFGRIDSSREVYAVHGGRFLMNKRLLSLISCRFQR